MVKEALLLLLIPLMVSLTAMLIAATIAIYLETIRPRLMEIRKERDQHKRAKITGVSLSMDIKRERQSTVKDDLLQYRQRA